MARQKMLADVSGLGLGDFGMPGSRTLLGVGLGGGVSAVVSLGLSHMGSGKWQQNADVIGLGAGLATAGLFAAMRKTRHLALPAAVGAGLVAGIQWLNRVVFGTVQLPAATAAAASTVAAQAGMSGLGLSTTRALGIARTRALNGAMGIATTATRTTPVGTIPGVAGPRLGNGAPPVSLMGPPTPAQVQLMGMGGPGVHGIAGAWGSTHFSK